MTLTLNNETTEIEYVRRDGIGWFAFKHVFVIDITKGQITAE